MDAAKKRIPEEALRKLILRHGYLEEKELQDCLDFQKRLSENSVKKSLEDIFIDSSFVSTTKLKKLLLFVEFIKIRWQGIAFCNIGLQKNKITPTSLTFALITQQSVYLLKDKIISLEELLVRKSKISEGDRETISSRLKELSLAEYERLLEDSFSRILTEDENDYKWRIRTPPPSKLEQPKKKLTGKLQRLISERRVSKEIQEKPPSALEKQEKLAQKPSSPFVDFDIDQTELHQMPTPRLHRLSSATVAIFLSAIVIFLIGTALYLTYLLGNKDEIDAISKIRSLLKEKEYHEAEKRCVEFRKQRLSSTYYREVTRYLQRIWLNDAGILYRQGMKQGNPKKLERARNMVPHILELNDETKEAKNSGLLLMEIAKSLKTLRIKGQFKQKHSEIREFINRKNAKAARKNFELFKNWLEDNGLEDEKFCQQCERIIGEQEKILEAANYRYYLASELSQKLIPIDSSPINEIPMTILPLDMQKSAKFSRKSFFTIINGYLCALDSKNGKINWLRYLGQSMLFSPIFIAGNREYYNLNLVDRVLVVSSLRNSLCLLNAKTGKTVWEKQLPEAICVQPVLYKDKIYVGCLDHYCYQLGLTTGNLDGAYLCNGILRYPPVFDKRKETLYLYSRNKICGYNLKNGKRILELKTSESLVAPVVAVSPYLYLFTQNQSKTRIYSYLLSQKQPQLLKNTVDVPGTMQSPASLAGGTLVVATETHLGIFCINPSDYKKALVPLSKPMALNDTSPTFMRFSNVARRMLVRRLLIAQEYLSVYQGFSNPSENRVKRTIHYRGNTKNFKTYLPIQKCGSSFLWLRISPKGDCLATCINLDGDKCTPLWQKIVGDGPNNDPLMSAKDRLLVISERGNLYEIYANDRYPCHLLAKGAGEGKLALIFSQNKKKLLLMGSELKIFNTKGEKSEWKAKIHFQGKLGQATWHGDNIFIGTARGVFAVSSRTGEKTYQEFSHLPYRPFFGKPVFYRNSIAIGCDDGKLYLLKLEKRPSPYLKKIGDITTGGPVRSVPLLAGNIVYFGSHDGRMYAANLKTGEILWRFATKAPVVARPTLYKKMLFFGSRDRWLYALSIQTGKLLWKRHLSGKINISPLIYQKKVYATSIAGDLHIFGFKKGVELRKISLGTSTTSPVVINDRVVLIGSNGFVYFLSNH